jgi:phospholipid/cholesterol/gamma-HCH transport system ATP-binding protein
VLKGVSLDVFQGETLVLLGTSGSGKSVLLKCITGLLKPDGGSIKVFLQDITNANEDLLALVRKRTGILFQGGALFDSMSVFDNVAFGVSELNKGILKKDLKKIVKENLKLVGLKGIENLMPSELSGGMRKRVALARAVAIKPEILFYDEPTTGLDPVSSRAIGTLIKSLQTKLNVTSIVVTHDIELAFSIADRITFLHNGVLIITGKIDEIKKCKFPVICEFIGDFYNIEKMFS